MHEARHLDAAETSDALNALRGQTKRGTFEDTVIAELQVTRATLVRLVVAVTGDKALGVSGLVEVVRDIGARLTELEKREATEATEKNTTKRNLALVIGTISGVSAAISWGLQWLAG